MVSLLIGTSVFAASLCADFRLAFRFEWRLQQILRECMELDVVLASFHLSDVSPRLPLYLLEGLDRELVLHQNHQFLARNSYRSRVYRDYCLLILCLLFQHSRFREWQKRHYLIKRGQLPDLQRDSIPLTKNELVCRSRISLERNLKCVWHMRPTETARVSQKMDTTARQRTRQTWWQQFLCDL